MKVREWMTPDPKSVKANGPLKTAVQLVVENRIRHLPVVLGESWWESSAIAIKRAMPSIVAGATAEEYQTFMEETSVDQVMTADPLLLRTG